MGDDKKEAGLEQVRKMTPVGRLGTAEEVAFAVVFLATIAPLQSGAHNISSKVPKEAKERKNPLPHEETVIKKGKELYTNRCLSCHGSSGKGDGPASASLGHRPPDLTRVLAGQTDGVLLWKISIGGGAMLGAGSSITGAGVAELGLGSPKKVEIKTPIGGFKNNYPALTLFALGFFPLIYPIYAINDIQDGRVRVASVRLSGPVNVRAYPVAIYASAEDYFVERDGSFSVDVPIFGERDKEYKVLLVVNGQVLDTQRVRVGPDTVEQQISFMPPVIEESVYQPVLSTVPSDYAVPQP